MKYFMNSNLLYLSEIDEQNALFFWITILVVVVVFWLNDKYEKNNWPKEGNLSKGQPLPNKIVFFAINTIWEDKTFIDEFRYILYDEGDIDEFTKELHQCHYNGEGTHHLGRIWYDVNDESFKPHLITLRIIERVANTIQFQNQILKYNLIDKDVDDFKKLFMHVISKREFNDNAIDYIINLKDIKPGQNVLKINYYDNSENSRTLKINPWELFGATV